MGADAGTHGAAPPGAREAHLAGTLFASLAPAAQRELCDLARIEDTHDGQVVIREGERAGHVYVVLAGEVSILGSTREGDTLHAIRTLGPGETVGELNLVGTQPASATVRVASPGSVLAIPVEPLRERMDRDPAFAILYRSLAGVLSERLRHTSATTIEAMESELEHARTRVSMGMLLMTLVLILSLFTYAVELMGAAQELAGTTLVATLPVALVSLIAAFVNMRVYRFPLSFYGLTLRNWRRAALEGVLFSIPVMALGLAGKWYLVEHVDGFRDQPLLEFLERWRRDDVGDIVLRNVLYVGVSIAAQEFVARGGIQSCLQRFLLGRFRVPLAILGASLIFSVTHVFISAQFGLLSFVLGCFWGWLYHRHGTLLGAYVSHVLIGFFGLEIMGLGISTLY